MTRDEAIAIRNEIYGGGPNRICDRAVHDVDNYIKLGMLKVDEPKSVEAKFRDALYEMFPDPLMLRNVRMCLDHAGLKIVEK